MSVHMLHGREVPMTATEVLLRQQEYERTVLPKLNESLAQFQREFVTPLMAKVCKSERIISAKRRRTLQRRGEFCWFVGKTTTGKHRYGWAGPQLRFEFHGAN